MMRVGFSGTQKGMTEEQKGAVRELIKKQTVVGHHGDCIGADADFHQILRDLGQRVELHPPFDSKKRAWCLMKEGEIIHATKPYLTRNSDIVEATEILIITPKEFKEVRRSGTWSTYRMARYERRPVITVWPNGECRTEKFQLVGKEVKAV